jgi:hypothetical protein
MRMVESVLIVIPPAKPARLQVGSTIACLARVELLFSLMGAASAKVKVSTWSRPLELATLAITLV